MLIFQASCCSTEPVVVVTPTLPRDGGMEKNHGAPECRELSRVWRVQNEMKGVLGPVFAGAAERILDFANPKETRIQQKAVFVAA